MTTAAATAGQVRSIALDAAGVTLSALLGTPVGPSRGTILALHGAGREQEAIAAFETCLAMGYEPHATHCRLAQLYFSRNPEKANRHREYAGLS